MFEILQSETFKRWHSGLKDRQAILRINARLERVLDGNLGDVKALRERADLSFVGLIGSKTKWATFRHRLEDRGFSEAELAHITCPIGVDGVKGKEPEVIAVGVAAQLLVQRAWAVT